MKRILIFVSLTLFLAQIQQAYGQDLEEHHYAFLLPPKGSVYKDRLLLENPSDGKGTMLFQEKRGEMLSVPSGVFGVQVKTSSYTADLRPDTQVLFQSFLQLDQGTLHVRSTGEDQGTLLFGEKLKVTFMKGAEFLLFIGGDKKERLVKVLQGEVQVEFPELKQKAVLRAEEATSTDPVGRLLIPFPFDLKSVKSWWKDPSYNFAYKALPIADSGTDQRVLGNIPVVLDGSKSVFQTGDFFEWTLEKGPKDDNGKEITEVAFESTNIVKPVFTPVTDGEYRFSLRIRNEDEEMSNLDSVVIFVGKSYLRPALIFSDVPLQHPNNLSITYLYRKNILKGALDKESGKLLFRPNDILNRVEILKILFENMHQKIPSTQELKALKEGIFLDVKPDHWFAPYVYLAKKMGFVKGGDGVYRPADQVIFVDAIKLLLEMYHIDLKPFQKKELPYLDAATNAWYLPYLHVVKKYNLLDPDENGKIHPSHSITRAELAEIIYRFESVNLVEKRGYLTGKVRNSKTNKGVSNAEIYFYSTALKDDTNDGFVEKGELYYKTITKMDGSFSVSLPVGKKFYIEAISGNNISSNRIVTEVEDDKTTKVELEISTP